MTKAFRRILAAAILLGLTSPAAAGQLGGDAGDVSIVRVLLALFVSLGVAVLAILLVRQRIRGGGPLPFKFIGALRPAAPRLALIESRRVAPQADLCLVSCDGEEYLLIVNAGGATVLDRKAATAAPAVGEDRL